MVVLMIGGAVLQEELLSERARHLEERRPKLHVARHRHLHERLTRRLPAAPHRGDHFVQVGCVAVVERDGFHEGQLLDGALLGFH